MVTKEVHYADPERYWNEYNEHLRHGGLLVAWENPPEVNTTFDLILFLPPDARRVVVPAQIVAVVPSGVGVQFTAFGATLRAELEQSASFCQHLLGKMSQDNLAPPPPLPPQYSHSAPLPSPPQGTRFAPTSLSSDELSGPELAASRFAPTSVSSDELSAPAPTASGSWVTLDDDYSSSREHHRKIPSDDNFRPTPEDWDSAEIFGPQEVLWSHTDIPAPSDLRWHSSPELSSPYDNAPPAGHTTSPAPPSARPLSGMSAPVQPPLSSLRGERAPAETGRKTPWPASPSPRMDAPRPPRSEPSPSPSMGYAPPSLTPPPPSGTHTAHPAPGATTANEAAPPSPERQASHPSLPPPPPPRRGASSSGFVAVSPPAPAAPQSPSSSGFVAPQVSLHPSGEYAAQRYSSAEFQAHRTSSTEHPAPPPAQRTGGVSLEQIAAAQGMSLPSQTPSEPSWTGSLEEISLLQVVMELSQQSATGRLEGQADEQAFQVYFYKGRIVRVNEQPSVDKHLLGAILVQDGKLNGQERNNALNKAQEEGSPLGEVLVGNQQITKRELAAALRKQMQHRLGALSEASRGTFCFTERVMPGEQKLAPPTSPIKLLFRHKMEWLGQQPYEAAHENDETYMDRYVFPGDNAEDRLDALGLTKEELYFWENLVTGKFRLRQIYAASNFRHRRTYTFLFALHAFGLVRFEREMGIDWQIEEMRGFFERRFMLLGNETFFELLGVHWTASQDEIQKAYKRIRREYDIANYDGEWPDDIVEMSHSILKHLEQVKGQLQRGGDRREYRSDVHDNSKLRFSAELFEQQGDMAMFRHDFREAVDRYSRALEINPGLTHIKDKLSRAKLGQRKYAEHLRANKGKNINYEAAMKLDVNAIMKRDAPNKDDN